MVTNRRVRRMSPITAPPNSLRAQPIVCVMGKPTSEFSYKFLTLPTNGTNGQAKSAKDRQDLLECALLAEGEDRRRILYPMSPMRPVCTWKKRCKEEPPARIEKTQIAP